MHNQSNKLLFHCETLQAFLTFSRKTSRMLFYRCSNKNNNEIFLYLATCSSALKNLSTISGKVSNVDKTKPLKVSAMSSKV